MSAKLYEDDEYPTLTLTGMVHRAEVSPVWALQTNGDANQLLLQVAGMGGDASALLYQEDIDALYEYLGRFVSR